MLSLHELPISSFQTLLFRMKQLGSQLLSSIQVSLRWDRKGHKQESNQCDNVIKCQNGGHKVALLEIKHACNDTESDHSWK